MPENGDHFGKVLGLDHTVDLVRYALRSWSPCDQKPYLGPAARRLPKRGNHRDLSFRGVVVRHIQEDRLILDRTDAAELCNPGHEQSLKVHRIIDNNGLGAWHAEGFDVKVTDIGRDANHGAAGLARMVHYLRVFQLPEIGIVHHVKRLHSKPGSDIEAKITVVRKEMCHPVSLENSRIIVIAKSKDAHPLRSDFIR